MKLRGATTLFTKPLSDCLLPVQSWGPGNVTAVNSTTNMLLGPIKVDIPIRNGSTNEPGEPNPPPREWQHMPRGLAVGLTRHAHYLVRELTCCLAHSCGGDMMLRFVAQSVAAGKRLLGASTHSC